MQADLSPARATPIAESQANTPLDRQRHCCGDLRLDTCARHVCLVAVLGFVNGDRPIFGIISNNMADTWLHVGIAAVSLILGFAVREAPEQRVAA